MGIVQAIDEDDDRNGDVTYSIQSVFGRNRFVLDRRSGVMTVNDALDFEKVRFGSTGSRVFSVFGLITCSFCDVTG